MTDQYSKAIDFAEMVLRGIVSNKQLKETDIEPMEILFTLSLPVINGTDDKGGYYRCADGALIWLLQHVEIERGAFDLARRIIASRLIRNEAMPEDGRLFAGLFLAGIINAPKKTKKAATFTHNVMLYWSAKRIVQDFGLDLTRGDNTASGSACDAVSAALERLGHAKSYRSIKDLCYHKSAAPMRQMAHSFQEIMNRVGSANPEMHTYWQSQAPWNSVTE
ncbi:hypothetical protein [Primorskyibacter flagellatus]|uniref:Uncharacterized protein n=1 Tax=Primorskyibacter flagellatus TaxID=1387277 RepID=A0A1W2DUB6_9RHOB|nr:hypothetical protein [Primorskyibacter flagellatus]SMD00997.1 hypothetical protein SAMN06295998_11815 [Primorskyibacter flagellatus]